MGRFYQGCLRCIERIHTTKCTSVWKLLVFFSFVQIVYFFDAGAISGSLSNISKDLDLSFTQAGKIATFFTLGYIFCCPILGHLETQFSQSTLLACGLFLYILGNSGVASSWSTITLYIARAIAGCGGAFYSSVALPYVEQIAPPTKKATCLGIFYSSMALGVSLGYVISGFVAAHSSWRLSFAGEVICMGVLFIVCFFIPWNPLVYQHLYQFNSSRETSPSVEEENDEEAIEIHLDIDGSVISSSCPGSQTRDIFTDGTDNIELGDILEIDVDVNNLVVDPPDFISSANNIPYAEKLKGLSGNVSYWLIVFGNTSLMFVISAFSYWSPSFVYERTGISLEYSNITVGMITFITGIFGTLAGGVVVDYVGGPDKEQHIKRSMIMISFILCIKAPLNFVIAFVTNIYMFIPMFAFSELLLFMTFAPVNKLLMNVVEPEQKTTANSLQLFVVKIFGDIVSPPVVGFIREKSDFTYAVVFLSFVVGVSAMFFILAWVHRIMKTCKLRNSRSVAISK